MPAKKWLRGDPDRPVPTDLGKLNALLKDYISPTHEPPWFYPNRGTHSAEGMVALGDHQSPRNIDLMAELGLHMPRRTWLFKAAGLVRERADIDKTIQYAKAMHDRGMLVSVYVGTTLFTDYFFKEVPEAVNWARRDQFGQPVTYGSYHLHRWFPCYNNPDYRAYLKRVLDIAVNEIHADEIFFDNTTLRHEPCSCRCKHCVEHVQQLVRRKYTLEQCRERYGFAEYPDIVPPAWRPGNQPWWLDIVRTPHLQDWIDHRVATMVDFYRDMAGHVKRQDPKVAVGMNIKGIHGSNRAFNQGVCFNAFGGILDYTCIDGYKPGMRDGNIYSEVRLFKTAQSTGISIVEPIAGDLHAAEDMVFNHRKFIDGHGWLANITDTPLMTPITQFLRENQKMYHQRRRLHDVAVLRTAPSINYNCASVHEQLMPFEQTLAVEKIPWTIVYDNNIDDLDRFRIIALPEIQAISEDWMQRLDAFMHKGGSVIASGKGCAFDAWYRPRMPGRGIARWLGHEAGVSYEVAAVGKGRLVYVPAWDVVKWDFKDWFEIGGKNLQPVRNRSTFLQAIDDAAGGRPLVYRITGNDTVFAEAIESPQGMDLHLINYDPASAGRPLEIRIVVPQGRTSAQISVLNPAEHPYTRTAIEAECSAGLARFRLPTPRVYAIVQMM